MKTFYLFIICIFVPNLSAQNFSKLPGWAKTALEGVDLKAPPENTKVWRILDETQITMLKNGKLEQERRVLQYVVKEAGAEDGSFFFLDGDERGVKIKRLKGWNLRPSGKLSKLEKENIVALGSSDSERLTTDTVTIAALEGVTKGSIVAFETREIHETFFPVRSLQLNSSFPIKKRIFRLTSEKQEAQFKIIPINLDKWGIDYQKGSNILVINNIPGSEGEILQPNFWDPFPRVIVGFEIGDNDRLKTWDHLAKWYYDLFSNSSGVVQNVAMPLESKEDLVPLYTYFNDKISYRQRYLSSARGWTPASGTDVERRAYGDCKDMVACLAWRLNKQKATVYPVLANIGSGARTNEADPPAPVFNHLIAAILIKESLGFPAEVEAGGKLYLLFDPTAKYTRPGYLPGHYRDKNLMIATPEGARWIKAPDTGLEEEALEMQILGRLDKNYTLGGTITLTESGDASFFRSLAKSGNTRDLEWSFRRKFDLPGVVDLTLMGQPEIDDQQRLKLTYQIRWPSFLRRDAGGLRLPFSIVGYNKRRLVTAGKQRIQPIAISSQPKTTWILAISPSTSLWPGRDKLQWKDEYKSFSWEAEGGKMLKITYTSEGKDALWAKSDISKGMTYWDTYRSKFNEFWLDGSIFMQEN